MLFNSYEFIFLFLPIVFSIYFYLNGKKLISAAKSWLVFSSLFFYSYWNINYLPLILVSILFNFTLGTLLTNEHKANRKRKMVLLATGVFFNLSLLAFFKYADFFIDNINYITDSDFNLLKIALPLAISFFTFQQITYLVDSYRGETKEYDFLNYTLFVTFFPQLIAGPIVHHKEMMPQFSRIRNKLIDYKNVTTGIFIFSIGLFKKVIIADTFSVWVGRGFDQADRLSFIEGWMTSLSYTFQIYFDFSGYTDMAIGAALIMNINIPINFNSPYKSTNIQDFWRRWHITLSRFLKDYLYIPLGGNKKGKILTFRNLFITFLFGGLWHGAGWTFMFWGGLHGLAMIVHRLFKRCNMKLNNVVAWFITFNFINITWVFFRANNWGDAIKVVKSMFGMSSIILPVSWKVGLGPLIGAGNKISFGNPYLQLNGGIELYIFILISFLVVVLSRNSTAMKNSFEPNIKNGMLLTAYLAVSVVYVARKSEFLYYQF